MGPNVRDLPLARRGVAVVLGCVLVLGGAAFAVAVPAPSPHLDATLSPQAGQPTALRIGQSTTFDLVVRNSGDATATGVSAGSDFDGSALWIASAVPEWTELVTGSGTWEYLPDIAPGQATTISVTYHAHAAPAGGTATLSGYASCVGPDLNPLASNTATAGISIAPRTRANLSVPTVSKAPEHGVYFTVNGTLKPAHLFATSVVLRVQVKSGAKFKPFHTYTVALARGKTTYAMRLKFPKRGTYQVCAYHADEDHLPTTTVYRRFSVK